MKYQVTTPKGVFDVEATCVEAAELDVEAAGNGSALDVKASGPGDGHE